MSAPLETSRPSIAPVPWRHWLAVAAMASLIAALAGFVTIVALIPLLLLPPLFAVALLMGLAYGFVLSLPVTMLLLPLAALTLERLKASRLVFLPLTGLAGGMLVVALVFTKGRYWVADANYWQFIAAGASAGLAAGGYFAYGWRKAS